MVLKQVLEKGIGRSSVANFTTSRRLSVGNTSTPVQKLIRSLRLTPAVKICNNIIKCKHFSIPIHSIMELLLYDLMSTTADLSLLIRQNSIF